MDGAEQRSMKWSEWICATCENNLSGSISSSSSKHPWPQRAARALFNPATSTNFIQEPGLPGLGSLLENATIAKEGVPVSIGSSTLRIGVIGYGYWGPN